MRRPAHLRGPVSSLFLLCLFALALLACGPGQAPAPAQQAPRYDFTRTRAAVVKLDTATGAAWFTDASGGGDWIALGEAPDPMGLPTEPGRYALRATAPARSPMGGPPQPTDLLLMDQETGRAWLSSVRRDASWRPIAEPREG